MMQAFAFNIRRDKFKDPRVRLAFNYAFDFEEMNKQIFFGQYTRIASYFQGTELAADRTADRAANSKFSNPCAIRCRPKFSPRLTPIRRPAIRRPCATISGKPYAFCTRPATRSATSVLVDGKTGEPYAVEFLAKDPRFESVFLFYKPSLERLGMTVSVRTIDDAQYQNRLRDFDFDIITQSWPESLSPGNEQRGYWGSQAADQPGSFNLIGIKNPGRRRTRSIR